MDIPYGSLTVPVLAALAGAAAAILVAVAIRGELRSLVTALVGIAAVVAVLVVGGVALNRIASAQQAASRQALDARRAALRQASESASELACIDGLVGAAVQDACRSAIFASPQTIAAAVALAAERLNLLTDGLAYAQRFDRAYAGHLAGLRRAVENDAYGLYSHVLAARDGCTAENCAAFALLTDDKIIKTHLREQTYAHRIAENSGRWTAATPPAKSAAVAVAQPSPPVVASEAAAPSPPTAADPAATAFAAGAKTPANRNSVRIPLTMRWPPTPDSEMIAPPVVVPPVASVLPDLEYPSAASIPPVSIMAPEPRAKTASSESPARAVPLPRNAPRQQAQ